MVHHLSALILAAGRQERWRRGKEPKQLLRVAGETLLGRMQRQLTAGGLEPVVATADPLIAAASDKTFEPPARRWTAETLLSCSELWGPGRTVVLLGDVVYSASCMAEILRCELPITFFMKRKEKWTEIVALTFSDDSANLVMDASISAVKSATDGRKCEARLAHVLDGLSPMDVNRVWITDWTQDFDRPEDYDLFDQSLVDDRFLAP